MVEKYSAYFKTIGIFLDLLILNLAGLAGYALMHSFPSRLEILDVGILHLLLLNFVWINVTQVTRLYRGLFIKDAIPTIKQTLLSLLIFSVVVWVLILGLTDYYWHNRTIWFMLLFLTFLILVEKLCFLLWRRSVRFRLIDFKEVVILGAGPLGLELKKYLDEKVILGYKVKGFFDDKEDLAATDLPILGTLNESISYAKEHHIKEIFCALPDRAINKIHFLMRRAERDMIRFKMVPDVKDYFKKNVTVQWFGHLPVLSPRPEPLEIKINQLLKRGFDLIVSLLAILLVLSWVIPLFALLIKLSSKGPVFFKQLRSGKDNEPFYCLKFRSMVVNEEADSKQASKKDSRVTKIGAFMRRNSIDELPQFINVLMGEMSIVGPRPHMLQHTASYAKLIDQFMVRHLVLPGITGWAQIKGLRGETTEDEVMANRVTADIWYLENWSLFLDMKIIFLTAWSVIVADEEVF
jgi:putative colanic acid biosynthesis UDP-glucose lipid carrier transferase